ncbi:hypothetical protein E2562_005708 [Oryza meyeriana var. granulata]|uniref:Uncharacterized protein n=1 Tax=Oryza meyeriana var. granulata TaxID=110450 RepID=A0A6G1F477_9ORYZ|nr:hypothetical protein E2562_005708 [Oryza meyeriana var. granulata]
MGLCFSKKRKEKPPSCAETNTSKSKKKPGKIAVVLADDKGKKTRQSKRVDKAVEPAGDKKAVFIVKTKSGAVNVEEKKRPGEEARPVVVTTMPVRTSSCTKEEVDAILIQCGRLSRSSSGRAASSETGGGHRRSKRSYDFDQERRGGGGDEERDWERQGGTVSRPSPHRGSPQRKRSGSRERNGSGSRRASRSPGRRAEGASSAAAPAGSGGGGGERARQQPGKMVSVPAREKGRAPSPAAASGKRCASPRSSSPARAAAVGNENAGGGQMTAGQTPSLSRSSSRKAEQSPYRRSPMAEIDENSLRNNNGNPHKKSSENALAAAPQKVMMERSKEKPKLVEETATVAASETRAPSSKTTATRTASVVAESLSKKITGPGCRSRRASRDFDQNPNSYATQLLEDIQSYHQQQNTSVAATAATLPTFSLPACVSKACSILEAVADLNSSSESQSRACEPDRDANDRGSVNAPPGGMDDLAEPSVHKRYVSAARDIRGETEPQESAGSNSVSGNPWTPSWEPNSVESTDRTWSSSRSTNNGDEVVEQGSTSRGGALSPLNRSRQSSKQRTAQPEPSVRSRAGSSGGNSNNVHRGRSAHRSGGGGVASGRSGVRAVSAIS